MLSQMPVSAVLPVVDIKRAVKFYQEKLGLKIKFKGPHEETLLAAGKGTTILLYQRPPVKVEHTQAGFWVENLDAEMEELRARGVVFEEYDFPGLKTVNGVATVGNIKSSWFKDTEGNILSVSQMS